MSHRVLLCSPVDGVSAPTTSTQVFYISVSVCCIVIFLVAIILAILHLHSMKRVEMEDRLVVDLLLLQFSVQFRGLNAYEGGSTSVE